MAAICMQIVLAFCRVLASYIMEKRSVPLGEAASTADRAVIASP